MSLHETNQAVDLASILKRNEEHPEVLLLKVEEIWLLLLAGLYEAPSLGTKLTVSGAWNPFIWVARQG